MPTASGVEAGRAFLRMLFDGSEAEAGVATFERRLRATGRRLVSIGAQLGGLGAAFSAPFVAAIRIASEAQETLNRFEQVFEGQAAAARRFADSFTGGLIQARRVTQDTLSAFFAQFRGLGAGADEAREKAEQLTSALADFESFNNLPTGEGLRRFLSAIAGEIEPLRRFGIDVSDARLDRELRLRGQSDGTRGAGFLQKANLRAEIILQTLRELNVIGDVERTFGQFANQVRAVAKAVDDAAVSLGGTFLPVIESITPTIIELIGAFTDLVTTYPDLVLAVGLSAAAFTAAGVGLVALGFAFNQIAPLIGLVSGSFKVAAAAATENAASAVRATAAYATMGGEMLRTTSIQAIWQAELRATAAQFAAVGTGAIFATRAIGGYAQALIGAQGLQTSANLGALATGAASTSLAVLPADTVTSIRTVEVTANRATSRVGFLARAMGRLRLASIATGAVIAAQFPTFIAIFRRLGTALRFAAGGMVQLAASTLAFLLTPQGLILAAVTAAVILLGREYLKLRSDSKNAEDAAKDLSNAFDRLKKSFSEIAEGARNRDVFGEAVASARGYKAFLDEIIEARAELNALEEAGLGNSDAANNLRDRLGALEKEAEQRRINNEAAQDRADPFTAAEQQLLRLAKLSDLLKEKQAELETARGSGRDAVVERLEAQIEGINRALDQEQRATSPAVEIIARQLQEEVAGGTADDPNARLSEIKGTIDELIVAEQNNLAIAGRFGASPLAIARIRKNIEDLRNLRESANKTVPSPVGGRGEPLLPGVKDDQAKLAQEERRRGDLREQLNQDVTKARLALIEDEERRALAAIENERLAKLDAAREAGAGQQAVNKINELAALESQKARADAAKKAADEEARLRERTLNLERSAEQAEINADPLLSDLEREIASVELGRRFELSEAENDEQRGLINRRFDAELGIARAREGDRIEKERQREIQQLRQLDISSAFSGSLATALQIGPDVSLERQQVDLLQELVQRVEQLQPGVVGVGANR